MDPCLQVPFSTPAQYTVSGSVSGFEPSTSHFLAHQSTTELSIITCKWTDSFSSCVCVCVCMRAHQCLCVYHVVVRI